MSTEFNSNINFGSVQHSSSKHIDGLHEDVQINSVDNSLDNSVISNNEVPTGQNAIAGKSQVKVDNIANDMLTFCSDPKLAGVLADSFFEQAYARLLADNEPNAYEKACALMREFVKEASAK